MVLQRHDYKTAPHNIFKTIGGMYTKNKMKANIKSELTEQIHVNNNRRQGGRLALLLLNIVMDQILK